ncbi:MAG: tRNA lysidine(34) synthetase TilS [Acidimicrobiia bacterium]|nr:tRNA lysidine(34) synthetase TilS [Acidimicrobiia bacterium]
MAEPDGGMTPEVVAAVRDAVPDGADVLVALGGGADSAVLLAATVEAVGTDRVRAVFVFHGLTGSSGLRDAAVELCRSVGVHLDVLDGAVDAGGDLEARARTVRYAHIGAHLGPHEVCVTGHTADDQAETVVMRLLRGSGADGLAGIPVVRGPYRRPLLGMSRMDLRSIARVDGLPFVDDPDNDDRRFLRARIRHDLIPAIEAEYSDSFRSNLVRSADLVARDAAVIDDLAGSVPMAAADGEVRIPTAVLWAVGGTVAARAVRSALRQFRTPYSGSYDDVATCLATAVDGTRRTLEGGVDCFVEGPFLVITVKPAERMPAGTTVTTVGGRFMWCGSAYVVRPIRRPSDRFVSDVRTALDPGQVTEFSIRGVADGDRIESASGSLRVVELMRAAGVPARGRRSAMVITVHDRIAAVAGIRVAPWARVTPSGRGIVIEREGHS